MLMSKLRSTVALIALALAISSILAVPTGVVKIYSTYSRAELAYLNASNVYFQFLADRDVSGKFNILFAPNEEMKSFGFMSADGTRNSFGQSASVEGDDNRFSIFPNIDGISWQIQNVAGGTHLANSGGSNWYWANPAADTKHHLTFVNVGDQPNWDTLRTPVMQTSLFGNVASKFNVFSRNSVAIQSGGRNDIGGRVGAKDGLGIYTSTTIGSKLPALENCSTAPGLNPTINEISVVTLNHLDVQNLIIANSILNVTNGHVLSTKINQVNGAIIHMHTNDCVKERLDDAGIEANDLVDFDYEFQNLETLSNQLADTTTGLVGSIELDASGNVNSIWLPTLPQNTAERPIVKFPAMTCSMMGGSLMEFWRKDFMINMAFPRDSQLLDPFYPLLSFNVAVNESGCSLDIPQHPKFKLIRRNTVWNFILTQEPMYEQVWLVGGSGAIYGNILSPTIDFNIRNVNAGGQILSRYLNIKNSVLTNDDELVNLVDNNIVFDEIPAPVPVGIIAIIAKPSNLTLAYFGPSYIYFQIIPDATRNGLYNIRYSNSENMTLFDFVATTGESRSFDIVSQVDDDSGRFAVFTMDEGETWRIQNVARGTYLAYSDVANWHWSEWVENLTETLIFKIVKDVPTITITDVAEPEYVPIGIIEVIARQTNSKLAYFGPSYIYFRIIPDANDIGYYNIRYSDAKDMASFKYVSTNGELYSYDKVDVVSGANEQFSLYSTSDGSVWRIQNRASGTYLANFRDQNWYWSNSGKNNLEIVLFNKVNDVPTLTITNLADPNLVPEHVIKVIAQRSNSTLAYFGPSFIYFQIIPDVNDDRYYNILYSDTKDMASFKYVSTNGELYSFDKVDFVSGTNEQFTLYSTNDGSVWRIQNRASGTYLANVRDQNWYWSEQGTNNMEILIFVNPNASGI